MEITKQAVSAALGIKTDAGLARYFGITRSAVTQWGESPIPEVRVLQLQVREPGVVARIQLKNKNAKAHKVEGSKRRKRG